MNAAIRNAMCWGLLGWTGLLGWVGLLLGELAAQEIPGDQRDRSPVDLIVTADETLAVTVNQTSDSVSLICLTDGHVLQEVAVGSRPTAAEWHSRDKVVVISSMHSGELHWMKLHEGRLTLLGRLSLGGYPTGMALAESSGLLYVALSAADQVAVIDWRTRQEVSRISVGRWPRYLALSPTADRLLVGTSGDRGISVVDTERRKLVHVDRFVGLNIGHLRLSPADGQVYFPWMVYRRNPITERNIRQGWVLASRLGRIGFSDQAKREALSLDPAGEAVADPHGLALSADGRTIVISAAGTHELLVLSRENLPFQERGSTDHIVDQLREDPQRFARIPVGGRPLGLRFSSDNRRVFVANYLDNSIQVVDLGLRQVIQRIFLGGPASPSLERQGEAIFFDARRSLDQWYSCHSCHYEGGSNAVVMDTNNDGSPFTFKTVLPLYELDQRQRWTWHGWQEDLATSLRHSLKTTMLGPEPSEEDVRALQAYLESLPFPPPSPSSEDGELRAQVERGRELFASERAGCAECHSGRQFTDGLVHDLGLGSTTDAHRGFRTPPLRGVAHKVLWLHDGRAASLEELLQGPHAPHQVHGEALSREEIADLVAYLRTL